VPHATCIDSSGPAKRDSPKSDTIISWSSSDLAGKRMFSGLISLCTIPLSCKYSIADKSFAIIFRPVCSGKCLTFSNRSNRSPALTSGSTKYSAFSSSNSSFIYTMLGWQIVFKIATSAYNASRPRRETLDLRIFLTANWHLDCLCVAKITCANRPLPSILDRS